MDWPADVARLAARHGIGSGCSLRIRWPDRTGLAPDKSHRAGAMAATRLGGSRAPDQEGCMRRPRILATPPSRGGRDEVRTPACGYPGYRADWRAVPDTACRHPSRGRPPRPVARAAPSPRPWIVPRTCRKRPIEPGREFRRRRRDRAARGRSRSRAKAPCLQRRRVGLVQSGPHRARLAWSGFSGRKRLVVSCRRRLACGQGTRLAVLGWVDGSQAPQAAAERQPGTGYYPEPGARHAEPLTRGSPRPARRA